MGSTAIMIGLGALLAVALAGGVLTWRRLWRSDSSRYGRLVYHYGVRWFGLLMWALTSLVLPQRVLEYHPGSSPVGLSIAMLGSAVLSFPICLWGGYWWGRTMALIFGVRDVKDY
jgi:hypothetical protein